MLTLKEVILEGEVSVERALDVRPTAAKSGTSLRERVRAVENIRIGGINNFGDRRCKFMFGARPQSINC